MKQNAFKDRNLVFKILESKWRVLSTTDVASAKKTIVALVVNTASKYS